VFLLDLIEILTFTVNNVIIYVRTIPFQLKTIYMNFTESLNLLLKATPDSVVSQLHELHRSIQSANKEEILAIYYTLSTIRAGFHEFKVTTDMEAESKVSQIDEICNATISRMAVLVSREKESERQKLYDLFSTTTGYNLELGAMCANLDVH